jgi:hypothetical protein
MEAIQIAKYNASSEWMIAVFLISLFLLSWVKNSYPKRFQRLLRSLFNNHSLFQVIREELVFSHRGSIVLTIIFILITGLFLTLGGIVLNFNIVDHNDNSMIQFGYWCLIITLVYFAKWAFNGLFRGAIQKTEYLKTYMFIVSIFNKVIGLILLPITILAAYLSMNYAIIFIKIGFVIWAMVIIYRLIKEVEISLSFKIPLLYIILYLCAFEISPFLIGIKLVGLLNI